MLGFISAASTGVKVAIVAGLVVAAGALYWYVSSLKSDLAAAQVQVGALTVANKTQSATIGKLESVNAEWKKSLNEFQKTLTAVQENQTAANEHSRKLNDVLSKHDLTALSLAKPGLIERRINTGSNSILRLFELESGGSADDRRNR